MGIPQRVWIKLVQIDIYDSSNVNKEFMIFQVDSHKCVLKDEFIYIQTGSCDHYYQSGYATIEIVEICYSIFHSALPFKQIPLNFRKLIF